LKARAIRSRIKAAGCLALALSAPPGYAGGYAILTQSTSSLGNVVAAGAAAEDASTVWANPAGMSLLPGTFNLVGGGTAVFASHKYQDRGSTGLFAFPGTGEGGDAGSTGAVPYFYLTGRLPFFSGRVVAGIGVNAPFGLKTEYDAGWRGAPIAVKSEAQSVNINPSLSIQLGQGIYFGLGMSVQRFKAELTNETMFGPLAVSARDTSTGFNVGVLVKNAGDARLGIAYRSAIGYRLTGDASFSAAPMLNGNVVADLKVPETLSVSGFTPAGPKWELMFDVTFTRWSRQDVITVIQTTGINAGAVLAPLDYHWRNTQTIGIAGNYKPFADPRTKIRFGIGYDQTPTRDATRAPGLPNQDSLAFAIGWHQKNPGGVPGAIDIAAMYQRIKDAEINRSTSPPIPGSNLIGRVSNKLPILALQYSRTF